MNDIANIDNLEGPGLLDQAMILNDLCHIAYEADKIGDVLTSSLLETCYEVLKDRISTPEHQQTISNKQAATVIKVTLLSILGHERRSIKEVMAHLEKEFNLS